MGVRTRGDALGRHDAPMSPFVGEAANLTRLNGFELGMVLADAIHGGTIGVEGPEREAAIAGLEDLGTRMEGRRIGAMAA